MHGRLLNSKDTKNLSLETDRGNVFLDILSHGAMNLATIETKEYSDI